MKKCSCGAEFEPYQIPGRTIKQKHCTACLIKREKEKQSAYAKRQLDKKHKELKNHVRSTDRKKIARSAKELCHSYIRMRDGKFPCISCGTEKCYEWHASHYFDSGQFSGLRYDDTNIHKSCAECNTHLHGNKTGYREGLIKRYGLEYVLELESKKDAGRSKKWSAEELTELKNYYKQKIRSK